MSKNEDMFILNLDSRCTSEEVLKAPEDDISVVATPTENDSSVANDTTESDTSAEQDNAYSWTLQGPSSFSDPFYHQKEHRPPTEQVDASDILESNSIPEQSPESDEESTTEAVSNTSSKLVEEAIHQSALELLSKISNAGKVDKYSSTTVGFTEAKYREELEGLESPDSLGERKCWRICLKKNIFDGYFLLNLLQCLVSK